jgi:hypothetical protein
MKARRIILLSLLVGSAYVAFVGCGDEETTSSPSPDAGQDTNRPPPPPQDSAIGDAFVDARSPDNTGSACTAATDCYKSLGDAAALQGGQAVCIDKVEDGYCTHECKTDQDCCAVPGECVSGLKQVCASFENSTVKYCFLSCEDSDINNAADGGFTDAGLVDGGFDGEEYCHKNASLEMGCRSTGGGADNRKACIPIGTGDAGPGDGGGKKDAGDAGDAGDGGDADAN